MVLAPQFALSLFLTVSDHDRIVPGAPHCVLVGLTVTPGDAATQGATAVCTVTVAFPLPAAIGVIERPDAGSTNVWPTVSAGSSQELVAGVMSRTKLVSSEESEPVCTTTPPVMLLLPAR